MANVNIKVGYTIDKNGLNEIKRQLTDIRLEAAQAKLSGHLTEDLKEASNAASQLEDILNSAWNNKLSQLDLSKVNTGIKNTYGSVQNLQQALTKSGSAGATAYNNFAMQVLNTNVQLKQTSSTLDKMAVTLRNTIRFGISSSIFNNLTNSIQKAYDYTVKLDTSLNDIRIVTEKSADEMDNFAVRANRVAKDLGRSTKDFTEASLIYYQQGLGDEESQARAEVTMKAANVTGQAGREVSEQLTSIWNGYKVTAEETELYIDKVAKVAAATAADLEELATGMSKVASAANLMGVDVDQLNAQLATIVSVTRQAPESVGVALKTIYARMSDIQSGLDDEVTLGRYTEKMAQYGVNVLDANGKLRDMGDVIEEIGGKWQSLSREQQIALSQIMAGTRQYNNLLSLFDNWDMYTSALDDSKNAAGELQKEQDIYMESTKAHLEQLSTEAERTYDILFDQDAVNGMSDAMTGLLSVFNDLLAGLGGGLKDFAFFGSTIANIFNKQIGASIERQIENLEAMRANVSREDLQRQIIEQGGVSGEGVTNAAALEKEIPYAEKTLELQRYLTAEQAEQFTNETAEIGLLEQRIQGILQYKDIAEKYGIQVKESAADTQKALEDELAVQSEKQTQEIKNYNLLKESVAEYQEEVQKEKIDADYLLEKQFAILDVTEKIKLSKEEQQKLNAITDKVAEGEEALTEKEIQFILEKQRNIRNQINQEVNELKIGAKGAADEESAILVDLQNEQILREKNLQTMQAQVERQKAISETVQGLSAVISLLTAANGIIETINDETLSTEEKQKRIFSVLLTNLPLLLTNLGSIAKLLPNIATATNSLAMTMGAKGVTAASGFGASLKGIISVAGPYVLAIGAVVAAIYALVKAYNADADAAKEAAAQAKVIKEEYQNIKTEYTELTDNISKYTDSLNALRKLEKGTKDWKEQVLELNEQIIELLDKYPQLAQYVVDKNGALGLTTEGVNQLLNNQWQAVQGAYRSNISAQLTADQKQLESDMTDFGRAIKYTQQERVWVEDRNDISRQQGSYEIQDIQKEMSKEEVNTLVTALRENGLEILKNSETLTNATGFNKELTNALIENKDSIVELNKKAIATDNAGTVFRQQDVQSYLASYGGVNYNNLSEKDQLKITNAIAKSITEESINKYREGEYNEGFWGVSGWGGGKTDKEIQKEYAALMGYNTDNIKDKSGEAIYRNASDEEVTISDKVAREALAQEAALKEAVQGTEEYAKVMKTMTEIGEQAAQSLNLVGTEFNNTAGLLKSGIQGQFDFSSATDEQLQALSSIRNDEGQWNNIQSMWDTVGWDKAGYDSAEAFTEAFDEQFNYWSAPERQAERAQNLAAIIEEQFNTALADDAEALKTTESALRSYTEHLMATNEELANDKLLAEQVAVASFQFADGVEALGKALDSNYDLLQDWRKGLTSSVEAYEAIGEMQDALEQMFNVRVSEDFIRDNFEKLKDVVNGDVDALEELQEAAAEDYVAHLYINADDTRINEVRNELNSYIDEFNQKEIQVGASIDDADFINALNNMMDAGELTSDQVQQYLNSIGYEPEFEDVTADTPPQTLNAVTDVTADLPILGPTHLATLNTSTTVDGVSATMFGISNATEGGGKKKLTGAHKVASTAAKQNAVRNNGSSGRKVGSGGGGKSGSGGSQAKEPDQMDPLEKEADRYHDVDIQLKLIDKDLDKLDKQKKKLFGQDLINNLNKRLGLLNKQIGVTNEKLRIAKGETQELQDKLRGKGVSFNADGTIANYAEAYASQLNYVNSLIAQYNSMGAEAQEGFKDTIEQAKEDFETFTSNLNRYDEVITDLIPGLEADVQAAVDEKIDLQIEKFDMEIEIRLNLAEAERDWNDFKKKIIDEVEDDDILGNAMARLVDFSSYYKDDNTGIVQALRKQVDNTLAELNQMDNSGWSNVYGDNRTAALEDLKKYYEELMTNLEDVLELQKEIHESYIDMMDEAQEKFDEQIKSYEMISDLIDHDMKVISLVYGEESYGQLAKYYDKQQQNFNNQLDFQRQQVDFWRAQLDALDEGSDAWENAKEKWQDAVGELNDLIESSIENLQDKYLNAINLIFQNLNNKVTDGLGLDYIEEEWNLINENADQYLDTINSLYEVQKLENKYLDALDNTDSISAQRQLKEIMDEELADLRERDKLTEYDIERANKKYEIALKQIALQEAQQNKTKMRLRRDSQGNYRYEYTADGDQIGQLQDELNDMYNSLYNFDKARYQDNLNQMYDVWVEFQEKMAEAAQINDPVARSERELLLQNQYEQLINGLTEQNTTVRENLHESAFDDLARLYDVDVSNFQNMSDEEKEVLMGDLLPYWESGVQHMTEVFAGEDGFLGVCKDAFDQLHDATKDYEDGLDELENTGRMDFDSIGEGIDQNIERTQQLITDNNELINSYEQELSAINNVIGELDNLVDKYNAAKDAAIAATKAAYEYWSEQQRQAAAAANNANGGSGSGNSGSDSGNDSDSSSGSGSNGDGNLVIGETATYSGSYYYDSYGTSPSGSRYSGVTDGIVVDMITNNPYGIHIHSADGQYRDLGWIKKSQLSGYDTGGYTGEWGNDGRLALLHQKELVLNKEDTANMLNAIGIMRNITNMLGSSVLGKLAAATAGGLNTDVGGDTLEQNVHIDAQFPNVKDSREIEEALNNLVNMASMRANKR